MKTRSWLFILFFITVFAHAQQQLSVLYAWKPGAFPLVHAGQATSLWIDAADAKVVSIAAHAFQQDIADITGKTPALRNASSDSFLIIAGTVGHSALIDSLDRLHKIAASSIKGKWETFCIEVVPHPLQGVQQALVVYGSDRRGTAFGLFELSKLLGVSPLKWWSDALPAKHTALYIQPGKKIEGPPSVKYRGLFINDEDWGLQPWAAKNMDTAIKDIGPNTYAKVFELMLRLKANYLWPAMHPCTKAFYYYPGNPKVADDYAIVVGSSHCEPMLRNNVFEWAANFSHEYGTAPGEWRYDKNQQQIYTYWKDRVTTSQKYESIYTVGMRGIHDGSMPGPKPINEKAQLLQTIITDQRKLLENTMDSAALSIPQIFCPYKEVLNVYRQGLQLPDDVTIVWADDNHGYIRQLSNAQEQRRSGHSGIYYHLSYWGAPNDYLWLSSISPALISYEMTKAYTYGADRLWVFNVGDIKPAEMELQFAMDLAWNVQQWAPQKTTDYIQQWATQLFGPAYANQITAIKKTYYQLAAAGKPEHLNNISFTAAAWQERLKQYADIERRADSLYKIMPPDLRHAYFELIYYPVKGAAAMNRKIFYAAQGEKKRADSAFEMIQALTREYNNDKWNGIMSWHPRDQPVFRNPDSLKNLLIAEDKKPIIIRASDFKAKKEYGKTHFETIEGLGINGKGVTLLPFQQPSAADSSLKQVSYIECGANLSKGAHTILLKCLPTQSIDNDGKLMYAISVNNDKLQWVNIHAESETAVWKQNVLRGYAVGKSTHTITRDGVVNIRIYFPDAGVVINTIEIE